jgi:hypothetical protein
MPTIAQRLHDIAITDSTRILPARRRDTGSFPLGHAASPSMGHSGADIRVGSRSQGKATRIPAGFAGSSVLPWPNGVQ